MLKMTHSLYDPFIMNLPDISPHSGLIPEEFQIDPDDMNKGFYTDVEAAETVLFGNGDQQDLTNRILDIAKEIESFGFGRDQMWIARRTARYHAANDYCIEHGYTMNQLFPGIQRDFDEIGLTIEQHVATYDAFQESKFEDGYRAFQSCDKVALAAIDVEFDRILEELRYCKVKK